MPNSGFSFIDESNNPRESKIKPLLCLEVNPPRGTELKSSFEKASKVVGVVDFFNVTDCALARMKFAGLPFGALLKKEYDREVMVNLACRDRNLMALQADLLAAWAMGVRSVVALTGDAVSVGDSPGRKAVFEVNSVGLLQTIEKLNSGNDLDGHELKGRPQFIAGAVCNPNAKNPEVEVKRLAKKVAAGAKYALSQPVFDMQIAKTFFSQAAELNIPLLMGLMPLKNARAIELIDSVPGIKLGEDFKQRANNLRDDQVSQFSIDNAKILAEIIAPFVRGFHIISGGYPSLANELVIELAKMSHSS